jgi:glyoxylase-like metal-dependent hydrolase (beta-lactamase superfamily II)
MDHGGQTRRHILRAAIGGAAGIVLGAPVRRLTASAVQAVPTATQQLSDDLFVITLPGEANVVAQTGGGGVLLVDGGSAKASDALMKIVTGLPGGGPVHTLFNTHWHPEQTGSNELVGNAGKTIIAHENTRLWLTTDVTWSWNGQRFKRLPKIAQPNKTFYTTGKLDSPKERREGVPVDSIQYGYIPDAAHTDGDLYVYFPKQNVLAVGDVVSGQGWPVVDWQTGGWIGGIVGGLQRLQTLANEETRIVPGRGPVLRLADLKAQSTMYGTIYDRLSQMLNKGRGPTEAVAAQPTKEFDARMGNGDEFVRRSFESLWAYLSPDA